MFCKIVAVAPAQVRQDGRVQAKGSPVHHATLGPLEEWLEEQAGPGVIDGIAERAVLREEYVKGERERLLAAGFMIRVIVLMTLVPGAGVRDAVIALAGDLALVPWARPWVPASERALGDWRNALGPEPLEELQDVVLRASHAEHEERDWRAVIIGRNRPLKTGAIDGTLIRVPDTPANRAMYGSVGTGDDSSPFPQLRGLPMTDASTRGLLGMPHGPAGTDKAAAEQKLLDTAMREFPHLFTTDRIWIMDRNYPGAARIARLTACTHVLIRLKSDIPLKRVTPILADGSYLAEISGDGVTVTVRVIECSTALRILMAGAGERRWGCRCGCSGRAADRLLVGGGALPTGRGVAGLHPGAGAGTVGGVGCGAALPVVFWRSPRGGPLG